MFKFIRLLLLSIPLSSCTLNPVFSKSQKIEKNYAAEVNTKLSMIYLEKKDFLRAKQKILMAQKQNPNSPVVWYVTGFLFEQLGQIGVAENAYLHAIKLNPTAGASQNNYAVFLCRQGKYEESMEHFRIATHDPNYLNAQKVYENISRCTLPSIASTHASS